MPKLQKHHYIPSFYLKHWTGSDGRLIEYRKGYKDRIFQRRTAPDGTGYVRGLNTIARIPDQFANYLEDEFLQRADDLASKALDCFLTGTPLSDPGKLRSGWSRFLMSMLHRHPERMSYLKRVTEQNFTPAFDQLSMPTRIAPAHA
jgi:Protein of unknown function (DUF4238)